VMTGRVQQILTLDAIPDAIVRHVNQESWRTAIA